jgi:predicted SAM-dependent methyltransferase
MSNKVCINLGAGLDRKEGFVNLDLLALPGIDVVHNLVVLPYPFEDEYAELITAYDVLEHLPNYTPDYRPMVIAFVAECHRILKPGGELFIQTPRYDAEFMWKDPTHVRGFHEQSMDFFDPDKHYGQKTGFYSEAKFRVECSVQPNLNLHFRMTKQ